MTAIFLERWSIMKYIRLCRTLLPCLIVLAISLPASASFTLYDKEGATFTVDGSFNTFYVYSDSDTGQTQSRVKMGFLPNWIGFNFSKQLGNLKIGGRSSFWVSINDSDRVDADGTLRATDTAIDVRQFYGTVDSDWGQVLIGKDFGLFNRSNIFLDEILLGFGITGGIDSSGVSFGNIGTGYTYPLPSAQITYRTPDISGFKLAVGILDPTREATGADAEEDIPRFEAEATYSMSFDRGSLTTWVGGVSQSSKSSSGDVDAQGISYGLNVKFADFSLTGSGFTGEGLSVLGATFGSANADVDVDGYLFQGAYTIDKVRLVASYGKNEIDNAAQTEDENIVGAVFYTVNDYIKIAVEYGVETQTSAGVETEIKTIALGGIINF